MPLKSTRNDWGSVGKTLHWLIVALVLWMAWLGLTMGDLPSGAEKTARYALHKSVGITLLAIVVLRLLWRLHSGAPLPIPGTSRTRARIASLTHAALYALLLAMPISGWVMNSAAGFPLQWFGLLDLPAIATRDPDLREFARDLHEWLFWALVVLAVLHAAAAFYHHLFRGDATLARMLPRGWLRGHGARDGDGV